MAILIIPGEVRQECAPNFSFSHFGVSSGIKSIDPMNSQSSRSQSKSFLVQSFLLGLLLIVNSCNTANKENQQAEAAVADAGFVPNPQTIEEREVTTLEIGQQAPDFNLPGIDGKFHQLSDYDAGVLVILFTCNHCPTAQAYEERIINFVDDYQGKDVQLVAISPNNPLAVQLEELGYSDLNDSYEEMITRAAEKNFNFPYLYDGDTQEVALKYGPVATPQAFVFDPERTLRYVGRLDAIEKPGAGKAEDLRAAVEAVLAGETPKVQETKTFGCSTKWGWKNKNHKAMDENWAAREVSLTLVDEAGIRKVLDNTDSDKLRLVNLWATWCGPCIVEYPEFIKVHRMYKDRDFEFVSLSADKPEVEGKVLAFLKDRNSSVSNYLFSKEDKYALIEAVDPEWNGALPYTLLIAPGGEILWRHQGEVDFAELKKRIVDHPMIGRYY